MFAEHCFIILYCKNYSQDPSESASKFKFESPSKRTESKKKPNQKIKINAKYSPMCKQVGEWCLARYQYKRFTARNLRN